MKDRVLLAIWIKCSEYYTWLVWDHIWNIGFLFSMWSGYTRPSSRVGFKTVKGLFRLCYEHRLRRVILCPSYHRLRCNWILAYCIINDDNGTIFFFCLGYHLREHTQEFQVSRLNRPPPKFRLLHLFVNDCNSVSEHVISLPVSALRVRLNLHSTTYREE